MRLTALLPLLISTLTAAACGTPCEPTVTADTLIQISDECLPQGSSSAGRTSVSTSGAESSDDSDSSLGHGTTSGMGVTASATGTTDDSVTGTGPTVSDSDDTGTTDGSGTTTMDEPTGGTGDSDTSGGTAATDSTGEPEPDLCFGDQCDAGCAPGLLCAAHPDNASLAVCASPCGIEGAPCDLSPNDCDPEATPIGECRLDFMGASLCFPILCPAFDCPNGSECVGGRCT